MFNTNNHSQDIQGLGNEITSTFLFLLLVFFLNPHSVKAQDTEPSFLKSVGFFADINSGYSYRSNEFVGNLQGDNVNYTSQDIHYFRFNGQVGLLSTPLITYDYQKTFQGAEFQQEAVETQVDRKIGLKRYGIGIVLDAIRKALFPDKYLLKLLFSTRYRYVYEITQNKAHLNENSLFILSENSINYEKQQVSDFFNLDKGFSFNFKTEYRYKEITIRPISIPEEEGSNKIIGGFRIGYSYWKFTRPFSTDFIHLNERPVLYLATLTSHALTVELESDNRYSPGLHTNLSASYDPFPKVNSSLNWNRTLETQGRADSPDIKVLNTLWRLETEFWYNHEFITKNNKGLFLQIGANWHAYIFEVEESNRNGSDSGLNEISNSDEFAEFWIAINLRF